MIVFWVFFKVYKIAYKIYKDNFFVCCSLPISYNSIFITNHWRFYCLSERDTQKWWNPKHIYLYNIESDEFLRFNVAIKLKFAAVVPHKCIQRLYSVCFITCYLPPYKASIVAALLRTVSGFSGCSGSLLRSSCATPVCSCHDVKNPPLLLKVSGFSDYCGSQTEKSSLWVVYGLWKKL